MTPKERDQMEPADTLPVQPKPTNGEPANLPATVPAVDPDEGLYLPDEVAEKRLAEYMRKVVGPNYCSIPTDTPLGRAKASNAFTGPAARLVDQVNRTLLVQNLAVQIRQFTSKETGEIIIGPRIVLVCSDGLQYFTSGKVPINALRQIMQSMECPPWIPPLPLQVVPWKGTEANRDSVTLVIDLAAYDKACQAELVKEPAAKGGKK